MRGGRVRPIAARVLRVAPARWARALRRVPLLGRVVHALSHRLWPPGTRTWVQVRSGPAHGLELRLDPRSDLKYWRGDAERGVQAQLVELLEPGTSFWDVGASLGFFTVIAARLVGPAGAVVAFEPDAAMADLLREHVARNDLENVDVRTTALWSRSGSVSFGLAGIPGHIHGRVGGPAAAVPVPAVALDDLVDEPPPHVVKIDVEGGEEEVLLGGRRFLATHRPVVVCEVHVHRHEEQGSGSGRLERVAALLASLGYDLERLVDREEDALHLLARPR